jgi:hypothetical protein
MPSSSNKLVLILIAKVTSIIRITLVAMTMLKNLYLSEAA